LIKIVTNKNRLNNNSRMTNENHLLKITPPNPTLPEKGYFTVA